LWYNSKPFTEIQKMKITATTAVGTLAIHVANAAVSSKASRNISQGE
jgi:hypothetical protein